ncbi:hypothetical protein QAD02_017147 [Eretmocerus hayati]|uniref:Uncharacterized protein n=1 Tax=Eretmocerus hayati TaxID=131215 RepID=A0ACC2PHX1_9HYME|nr:hypothetical protein QAD02_017147 [Eretmocerus hayati]
MSSMPTLIRFQHCSDTPVFCRQVPKDCPVCGHSLATLELEPVLVPCPLVNAVHHPCSLVVRCSKGSFLDEYHALDDLHIGITDSCGVVFEYDACGLVKNDNINWQECAAISVIPDSWETYWDEILVDMLNDPMWQSKNYDDAKFNCFNFVTSFLEKLKFKDLQFLNKEELCEAFILPKIQTILKYAIIYKHLKNQDFFMQDRADQLH